MSFENHITTAILGAKGSGKSVFLASICNSMNKTVVLFDMLGVFNPRAPHKTAVVPNSYYVTSPDAFIANFDKFPEGAKIVVDFSECVGADLIEAMDKVCKMLMDKKRKIAVLSDEVADFMAQQGTFSVEFWRMTKNGRNFGIKPVIFASQRPQDIHKNIFDLCDDFLISKQRAPRTVDYLLDIMNKGGDKEQKAKILALQGRTFLHVSGENEEVYNVPTYKHAFKQ